jgi:hypothetical protein
MAAPAERMKMLRQRRRARGLRELRLVDRDREHDALKWIESVSKLDADATR